MTFSPCLIRSITASGEARFELGDPLLDCYLEFVAGRARPNTLRAVAFDSTTFFAVVGKDPLRVEASDVFEFLAHQRGDRTVIRISDRVAGLYAYLIARGDTPVAVNLVPRGLSTRRRGGIGHSQPEARN